MLYFDFACCNLTSYEMNEIGFELNIVTILLRSLEQSRFCLTPMFPPSVGV
ncbi:hypothetical protein HanPSC8_Chr15g0653691 [Helianthus annuus]|nr:hypothetical protein HanPSC8_Chr15g0653691 [Helianthus annuus]